MAPVLLYGPHQGYPPLRRELAQWLSEVYSPPTGATTMDRICITNGASGNLANVLIKFTDPSYTRRIFMVEPTYFLACPIFEDCGFLGKLRGVPETVQDGVDIDFLRRELENAELDARNACLRSGQKDEPAAKCGPCYPHVYKYVIYLVPTYSNPSGKTVSVAMRKQLVLLAREFDALLITDDVYDFLSWQEDTESAHDAVAKPPPRLVDIDRSLPGGSVHGNCVSNGSFSKLIGPGVRVGWAEGTPAFVSQLAEVGSSSSGGAPSHLASTFVEHMLRTQWLQHYIRDILVPTYKERYCALMTAIADRLIPLGYAMEAKILSGTADETSGVAGGFFTYLRLPLGLPFAKVVAAIALKDHALRIAFGHMFTVAGDHGSVARAEADGGFAYCVRLCWAWHEADEIQEGVLRLAAVTKDVRARVERGEDVAAGISIGIR
ncbi:hypothetical protein LTR85_000476 [Meristemomyces frigidus]|nr:hypothetical protein LTR85_000476 [Meristemomyces frigidus]